MCVEVIVWTKIYFKTIFKQYPGTVIKSYNLAQLPFHSLVKQKNIDKNYQSQKKLVAEIRKRPFGQHLSGNEATHLFPTTLRLDPPVALLTMQQGWTRAHRVAIAFSVVYLALCRTENLLTDKNPSDLEDFHLHWNWD